MKQTITKPVISYWQDISVSSSALALAEHFKATQKTIVVITNSVHQANEYYDNLRFFLENSAHSNVLIFPDRETLPFDQISPHKDIISTRVGLLHHLPEPCILLCSINTLMNRLPPVEFFAHSWNIEVNDTLDLSQKKQTLSKLGYYHTTKVMEPGEFCVRGSLLDIFPMGHTKAYRINLFDDVVETISSFDPESQISNQSISQLTILPSNEFTLDKASIDLFKRKWLEHFSVNPKVSSTYQDITKGIAVPGIEYYLPLLSDTTASLLDYLPKDATLVCYDNLAKHADDFYQEISQRYQQFNLDSYRPLLPAQLAFHTPNDLLLAIKSYTTIKISKDNKHLIANSHEAVKQYNVDLHAITPLSDIADDIQSSANRILLVTESLGRQKIVTELFQEHGLNFHNVTSWDEFIHSDIQLAVIARDLHSGIHDYHTKITILTEYEIFGHSNLSSRTKKTKHRSHDNAIKNLLELNVDDIVVHLDYGIGIYRGLESITVSNITNDYLILEYAKEAKIYLPTTALQLISHYRMGNQDELELSQLGNNKWQKNKTKALQQMHDVAAELLNIQAQRQLAKGYTFQVDNLAYYKFCARFGYEETPDQLKAINEVIHDMQSGIAMDRLICGDVGFGKTEIAMRAAFVAVSNQQQVCILVPTTLLAEQHYQNFTDRFSGYATKIVSLSRFNTPSEKKHIKESISNGSANIIIGTHGLIQKDISFANLGLLIIDEEHRFGVRQKEYIKKHKNKLAILSLTATPIPRTMHMSMSGIRDISILATPPTTRLAVKTFVIGFDKSIIREALLREMYRGGQVYYLHNDIAAINNTAKALQELVPQAKIAVAHGKLPEHQLEKIMSDFYHGRFHVLVCTTIIETGLDIANTNTIIINRADKYGLAQLYQLRGRVGRSHHQAYAYLITPDEKTMTKDAKKRINAMQELNTLGAGFTLASYDLDIRGAGDLLGEEQSGNMQNLGFGLYMELLDKTIKLLKQGKCVDPSSIAFTKSCEINLGISTVIPNDYIHDTKDRLVMYKKIADASTTEELDEIYIELVNRFGNPPLAISSTLAVAKLRILAEPLSLKKIEYGKSGISLQFHQDTNIDPAGLLSLIMDNPSKYALNNQDTLLLKQLTNDPNQRIELTTTVLDELHKLIALYS